MDNRLLFVFLDIGGTLGERDPSTGLLNPFPSTIGMLKRLRDEIGVRMGIITTLGPLSDSDGKELVQKAGLSSFFDANGFVSEHTAHVAKPRPAIYHFAADRVSVPIERCLYIGENLLEVIGAQVAGMPAILKPCPPGREVS